MRRFVLLVSALVGAFVAVCDASQTSDELVKACTAGDLAAVRQILSRKVDVNETDSDGRLPLLAALFSKAREVVSLLLQRGADPNLVGYCPEKQCTSHPALVFAAYLNQPELVKLLLDAKADIAWKDHLATRKANTDRNVEVFKILRAAGGHEWQSPSDKAVVKPAGANAAKSVPLGVSELLPAMPQTVKPAGTELRLAIIADESTQAAADLLASELNGHFQLVERNELERVLDEQKLSRQFAADAAKIQKVGALLGADAIAIVRKIDIGGESVVELRLVRVSPGIVLDTSYRSWPLPNAVTWAGDAAARLNTLAAKVRDRQAIALSPADFRPATNSRAATNLARQAALLVTDRLVRQPGVVVLERAAIADLARERALSGAGEFWAGSYLVDGTAEASLDGNGQETLTLRLQPMGDGAALTFTARGESSQIGGIIEQLISQATKALALLPAQVTDPLIEAERYFAESRAAYQRSLFLTAYRAAETAALLGLHSPEFTEWRLKVVLRVISWQVRKIADGNEFIRVRFAGWGEAWMNDRMGGEEWLRIPEWLEIGRQSVELWHELLRAALESGDLVRVQAAMDYQREVSGACFGTWWSANLSATILDRGEQMEALPRALRDTLEEALSIADRDPSLALVQARLAVLLARYAGALYPDQGEYTKIMKGLLGRHFAAQDIATRAAIRNKVAGYSHQVSSLVYEQTKIGFASLAQGYAPAPAEIPSAPALLAALSTSKAPEDLLTCEILRFRLSKAPVERRAISERLFKLIWEVRQLFVDEPRALQLASTAQSFLREDRANAMKFAASVSNGQIEYTPELQELRRKLFLLVARETKEPGPAFSFYDEDFHPAGENIQELTSLRAKVTASYVRYDENELTGYRQQVTPTVSTPKQNLPKQNLPKTPTYAHCPPFKVTRCWTAAEALPDGPYLSWISQHGIVVEGDHVWLYGQSRLRFGNDDADRYLLRVSLSSLQTEVWPLPSAQQSYGGGPVEQTGAVFLVEKDRVFVNLLNIYFAVGDRKSGKWQVNRDLHPAGNAVRVGSDLFFLTERGGVRGMARYSIDSQQTELLASTSRIPQQTPIDNPSLEARSLRLSDSGVLEMYVSEVNARTPGTRVEMPAATSTKMVSYDPVSKTWKGPEPLPPTSSPLPAFTPLKIPGIPKAYQKGNAGNVWTVQLARDEMPKARIPFEFVPAGSEKQEKARANVPEFLKKRWYWTPEGYFVTDSLILAMWFIPQSELDAYLDSHEPKEDETSSQPPVIPVKAAGR